MFKRAFDPELIQLSFASDSNRLLFKTTRMAGERTCEGWHGRLPSLKQGFAGSLGETARTERRQVGDLCIVCGNSGLDKNAITNLISVLSCEA